MTGTDKTKVTVIMNRVDFTNDNTDIEFCKRLIKLFSVSRLIVYLPCDNCAHQDNYPERLKLVVVYPAGLVFYGLWNIVRWFLDPVTQAKIKPVLTFAGVQEFIDDEWIPVSMGGKDDYVFNIDDYLDPYSEEEKSIAASRSVPITTANSAKTEPLEG